MADAYICERDLMRSVIGGNNIEITIRKQQ